MKDTGKWCNFHKIP
jgi:hypothetical protein